MTRLLESGWIADVHSHFFPPDLPRAGKRTSDQPWPWLLRGSEGHGRIMCGDQPFREVRSPLWDVTSRASVLAKHRVGLQVVSPTPVLMCYWAEPSDGTSSARYVNDALAQFVALSDGALVGLGTVALQDPRGAAEELRRVIVELGLRGVQIGANVAGAELDDPRFAEFFDAAEELRALIYVHPADGGAGAIRRGGPPYDFGLGMLTDTALAAIALVCGGVLSRRPRLRVAMSHGCGVFPWAAPRLSLATRAATSELDPEEFALLSSRLWVDTLVYDHQHLRLLVHRFGAGQVMFGSDYPFIPGQLDSGRSFVAAAEEAGAIAPADVASILSANVIDFLKTI
jgi:aminocarboxymuconate-semialdehyde decarboxylase